ncbi:hypothetical protein D3C75_681900 [compost metagenome]
MDFKNTGSQSWRQLGKQISCYVDNHREHNHISADNHQTLYRGSHCFAKQLAEAAAIPCTGIYYSLMNASGEGGCTLLDIFCGAAPSACEQCSSESCSQT